MGQLQRDRPDLLCNVCPKRVDVKREDAADGLEGLTPPAGHLDAELSPGASSLGIEPRPSMDKALGEKDRRIDLLEGQVSSLQDEISRLKGQVSRLEGQVKRSGRGRSKNYRHDSRSHQTGGGSAFDYHQAGPSRTTIGSGLRIPANAYSNSVPMDTSSEGLPYHPQPDSIDLQHAAIPLDVDADTSSEHWTNGLSGDRAASANHLQRRPATDFPAGLLPSSFRGNVSTQFFIFYAKLTCYAYCVPAEGPLSARWHRR